MSDNYTKVNENAQAQWGKLARQDSEAAGKSQLQLSDEALINFQDVLEKYRERTEFSLPYTIQQMEDVMFIDQQRLVTLEYIFYQTGDAKYSKLKKNKTNKNHLGSENFIESSKDGLLNKDYKDAPISYHDPDKVDYLVEHSGHREEAAAAEPVEGAEPDKDEADNEKKCKKDHPLEKMLESQYLQSHGTNMIQCSICLKNKHVDENAPCYACRKCEYDVCDKCNKGGHFEPTVLPFMDTETKDAKVEALISLWKIDTGGQLTKNKEISFSYNSEFKPSIKGQMRLSLSHCKKYVILPVVKKAEDAGQHFFDIQLLRWSSKNLKASKFNFNLNLNLERVACEKAAELVSVDLVSNSKYILLKVKNAEWEDRKASMNYHIYDVKTGNQVLKVDNQLCSNVYTEREIKKQSKEEETKDANRDNAEIRPETLSCIDLLVERGEDLGDNAADEESESESGSSGSSDDDSDYGSYGGESSNASGRGSGGGSGSASKKSEGSAAGDSEAPESKSHHSGSKAGDSASKASEKSKHSGAINASGDEGEGSGGGSDAPEGEEHGSAKGDSDGTDKEGGEEEGEDEKEEGKEEVKNELKLVFFFAADFNHKNEEQWVMGQCKLTLAEILAHSEDINAQSEFIKEKGLEKLPQLFGVAMFMEVPQSWFLTEKLENDKDKTVKGFPEVWSGKIEVTMTGNMTYIAILNTSKRLYLTFVHNYQYEYVDLIEKKIIQPKTDAYITRNQQTKEHLMLHTRVLGEDITAFVYFGKQSGQEAKVKEIRLTKDHFHSMTDCQVLGTVDPKQEKKEEKKDDDASSVASYDEIDVNLEKNYKDCCIQACTLSEGDQEVYLKTLTKQKDANSEVTDKYVIRKTKTQNHQGSFPIMMYNIGQQKMIIQMYIGVGRMMVYEIDQKQRFYCFIDYNNLKDLGFTPNGMNIEACSQFCFLTQDCKNKQLYINIMIVDPYFDNVQISVFHSSNYFESKKASKFNDLFVKCIIYSTGPNNEVKMIQQYNQFLHTTKLREEDDNDYDDYYDSDNYGSESSSDDYSDSDGDEPANVNYESVQMLLSSHGRIYYVVSYDGQCTVKEISQKSDAEHATVFEIKSEKCLGFAKDETYFYFVDDQKVITQLHRSKETRQLEQKAELHVKAKDRPHFQLSNFADIQITEKYVLTGCKIFYLYKDDPLDNGILDMEQLSEIKEGPNDRSQKNFAVGPVSLKGSDQFMCVYNYIDDNLKKGQISFKYMQRIYQLPCSSKTTLLNDEQNKVKVSTFLQSGNIFVQINYRYFLFDRNGKFLDDISFEDLEQEKENMKQQKKKLLLLKKLQKGGRGMSMADNNEEVKEVIPTRTQVIGTRRIKDPNKGLNASEEIEVEVTETITQTERMHLRGMSDDNKYFLFEDRIKREWRVYTLKDNTEGAHRIEVNAALAGHGHLHSVGLACVGKQRRKQHDLLFALHYKFDFFKSKVSSEYQLTEEQRKDPPDDVYINRVMRDFEKNALRLTILNDGRVIVNYSDHDEEEEDNTDVDVKWSVFDKGKEVQHYDLRVHFKESAKKDYYNLIKQDVNKLKKEIAIEKQTQSRLPEAFQDSTHHDEKVAELEDQGMRKKLCVNSYLHGEYVIVQCGNQIKYTKITDEMIDGRGGGETNMTDAKIQLSQNHEIITIMSTCLADTFQVIVKDNHDHVLIIVTWDFIKNIEASMLQVQSEDAHKAEYYVTKGMTAKMNYFVDSSQIFDLEYNIPLQYATHNTHKADRLGSCYNQQRKIFEDSSRFLSIDPPNFMNFPLTRYDIVFWMNIKEKGQRTDMIRKNTELYQYNLVFGDYSLFHYFSGNVDVIEMIHDDFKEKEENDELTGMEKNMPLVILSPDNNGLTALDWAIKRQRPKSFELMINLLEPMNNFCLSKMMLSSFPGMIKQGSDMIWKFFNTCSYKPVLCTTPVVVYWPQDCDEFVFASPTSLITAESLKDALIEHRKIKDIEEECNKPDGTVMLQNEDDADVKVDKRKALRPQQLIHNAEEVKNHQRVAIDAIDFDWIFKEDNAENLIKLLSQFGKKRMYVTQSFKCFIDLMWGYYQPAIIRYIFVPYLVYLLLFIYMTSKGAGEFLDTLVSGQHTHKDADDKQEFKVDSFEEAMMVIVSLACIVLWLGFFSIECRQLLSDPVAYVTDYWNIIDLVSASLNIAFIFMLDCCVMAQTEVFPATIIRTVAALAAFLLWIKVFYWMRLFRKTAYFITLITQTIFDIRVFVLMLLLIISAFANFYFIINNNTPENPSYKKSHPDEDFHYVDTYVGQSVFDALIAMYLLALGEFDIDGTYTKGPDIKLAWFFFILATFIILVVFMNMLIAIMSDTFANVLSVEAESSLDEQLKLIEDFMWLLDLNEIFKDHKYIIRVKPDVSIANNDEDIGEQLEEVKNILTSKNDKNREMVVKRIAAMEKNNRSILKQQQGKIVKIQKLLIDLVDKQEKASKKDDDPKAEPKRNDGEDSDAFNGRVEAWKAEKDKQ